MNDITTQKLRTIQRLFEQFQTQFNVYNSTEQSEKNRDIASVNIDKCIIQLEEFGLYYRVYDEDETHSYIRPATEKEEYNNTFQAAIECACEIVYEQGPDEYNAVLGEYAFAAKVLHEGEFINTLGLFVKNAQGYQGEYAIIQNQMVEIYTYEQRQSSPVSNDILSWTTSKEAAENMRKLHPHIEHDPWYYM